MDFIKKTVEVQGRKVFYLEHPAEGKALVVLHGFPGSHLGLLPFVHSLRETYRVILPDLPACGDSAYLEGSHSLEAYAHWLADFLAVADVPSPVIVGHSFGARVALVFSSLYPQQAMAYVFLMPVARVSGFWARLVAFGYRVAGMLGAKVKEQFFASNFYQNASYFVSTKVFQYIDPVERDMIIRRNNLHMKTLDPNIHWELFGEFYGKDLTSLADAIQVPSLVIAGGRDIVASLGSVRKVASRLKYGEIKIFPRGGHLLPFEHPQETVNAIESWLDRLPSHA